jgi:uncharacterized protein YegP (UPF0339 family)
MIKLIKNSLLLIIPILLAFSCKKEEERRLGDGTISCYINGKLWQNSEFGSSSGGIKSNSYSFVIDPSNDNRGVYGHIWDESTFYFFLVKGKKEGEFKLKQSNGLNIFASDNSTHDHMNFHSKKLGSYLSKENSGWIKVTKYEHYQDSKGEWHLDYEGEFEATLYNKDDPSDIIEITDGRFNN